MREELIKISFGISAIVLVASCSSSSSSQRVAIDAGGSAGTGDNTGGTSSVSGAAGSGFEPAGGSSGSDAGRGGDAGAGGAEQGGASGIGGSSGGAGAGGRCGDLTLCGETCVDTKSDPLNCGICDRDCLGAACAAGQCQPASIHAETGLARFAVDKTHVYYFAPDPNDTKRRAVRRVPISGDAAPQNLALDQTPALAELLIDGTHVYWAGGSNTVTSYVRRVPKLGGAAQDLKTGTDAPGSLGANSSTLFFAASDPVSNTRFLHKVNKDGGDYAELESTPSLIRGVAASSSFVYYADFSEQALRRRTTAKLGAPVSIVPDQTAIEEVIFDTNEVFWTAAGIIRKASADGKNVVDIATATGDIEGLAVDATNVYWTELVSGQRDLITAQRSGGGQRTLLTGIGTHSIGIGAYQVHSDGTYVYYLNAAGDNVMRVAK